MTPINMIGYLTLAGILTVIWLLVKPRIDRKKLDRLEADREEFLSHMSTLGYDDGCNLLKEYEGKPAELKRTNRKISKLNKKHRL